MLTGEMPFDGNSQGEVFGKIKRGNFHIPKRVSADAKDLLQRMIKVEPRARISAAEILNHPWITKHIESKCCDETTPHEHVDEA